MEGTMTNVSPTTERRSQVVEAGGAATESMGGVAVVVLTILALAGALRPVLTDVAGIIFGAAFMIEGAALAARRSAIDAESGLGRIEVGGGMSVELVAGLAALVLGILSLVSLVPAVLMPSLVIVGGVGLMLSAGTMAQLNDVRTATTEASPAARALANAAVSSAVGGQVLAGLAAVVLGIVALVRPGNAYVLTSVGLLVLGAAITLSGTALSGKLLSLFPVRR
jgi:hypothetical protein